MRLSVQTAVGGITKTVAVLGLTLGASLLKAEDWPRWRGPHLNGISQEKGWSSQWPAEGPRKLWSAKVGIGFSSFSVASGKVLTLGNHNNQDSVFCLDAKAGTLLWKHTYDCPLDPRYYDGGTSATPTMDGDKVYSLSRKGHLFCFNLADGKVVWQKNLTKDLGVEIPEWGFASSPLIEGDLLIVNVGSAGTALKKSNGEVAWTSGKGPSGYSSAVPYEHAGKRYVAMASHEHVLAAEVATGKTAWMHPWKTDYNINAADPVIQGSEVFISSGYNHGAALLKLTDATPTVLWENKSLHTQFSTAVLIGGHLYGIDGNNGRDCSLKCVAWQTGQTVWEKKGAGMGSLMAADGKLLVMWEKGAITVVNATPQAYQELSRAQVLGGKSWTQPVLSNGRLYCRNSVGEVVCLDVSGH